MGEGARRLIPLRAAWQHYPSSKLTAQCLRTRTHSIPQPAQEARCCHASREDGIQNTRSCKPAPFLFQWNQVRHTKSLISHIYPSLCRLGNLLPPSAGTAEPSTHTSSLPLVLLHRVPEKHTQHLQRAWDTDTYTDTDTHPRGSRKRETELGGGLLGRAATAPWHGAVRAAPAR